MATNCPVATVAILLLVFTALLETEASSRRLRNDWRGYGGPEKIRPLSLKRTNKGEVTAQSTYEPFGPFNQTADAQDCISDPKEFLRVWKSTKDEDRVRCVDPSIIVRLAPGRGPSSGDTLNITLRFALSRLSRPISFWAFKDATEKYVRIGNPQTIGSYVNGFPSNEGQNAPYLNSLYPSIKKKSSGTYFLQQIGFPSTFYDADIVYTMIVGKRPAPDALSSFVPTWDNLRIYFTQYVQRYLASIGSNQAFDIPVQVVSGDGSFAGMANLDFAALTGCPAQCTYEDRSYPDLILDVTELSLAKVPAVVTNHTRNNPPNTCETPRVLDASGKNIGPTLISNRRLVPAAPTAVAESDWGCNALWSKYYIRGNHVPTTAAPYPTWRRYMNEANVTVTEFDAGFPGFYDLCTKTGSVKLVLDAFVQYMNAALSNEEKAIIFRAFLMTSCAGNFNPLFSGNGFIYTGTGGISSGTVHEVLMAQIDDPANAVLNQGILGDVAYTFFCLDGSKNCCPKKEPNCEMASR